jgi:hypothetical protein
MAFTEMHEGRGGFLCVSGNAIFYFREDNKSTGITGRKRRDSAGTKPFAGWLLSAVMLYNECKSCIIPLYTGIGILTVVLLWQFVGRGDFHELSCEKYI